MQRVWGSGRDLSITASSGQSQLRELRLVVSVDQIMGYTRVVGLRGEQLFQDRGCLPAIRKSRILVRFRGEQESA